MNKAKNPALLFSMAVLVSTYSHTSHAYQTESAAAKDMTYTLIVNNKSSNPGSIAVYQTDPDIGVNNVMSLAWFSKYAFPDTKVTFNWKIAYNFVWENTGTLIPGVIFSATQTPEADLTTSNQITLNYDAQYSAYYFEKQRSGTPAGSLIINEAGTVPLKQASVGIGMSGYGTFVVQAQPNLKQTFTPHPRYWVTFGNYTQGEVLDVESITNPAEIKFEPNIYSYTATLNPDNSWTVAPTQKVNAKLLKKSRECNCKKY